MLGRDDDDPLFLQLKEAQASVLEPFLGTSKFGHHGQRVVDGQRLTQAASDVLLGWMRMSDVDGRPPRLLRPPALGRQGLALVETMNPRAMTALRRGVRTHARAGARALRGRDRDRSYLGRATLRPRARVVRRGVRRPERARLRRLAGGRGVRSPRSRDRPVTARRYRRARRPSVVLPCRRHSDGDSRGEGVVPRQLAGRLASLAQAPRNRAHCSRLDRRARSVSRGSSGSRSRR